LRWRVLELDPADHRARLAPELSAEAVVARLDEVCGVEGWSKRYLPFGAEALVCELTIDGVTKAEVVHARSPQDLPEALAGSALSRVAANFGLRPPIDDDASAWVDADPETGEPLHPPEVGATAPAADVPALAPALDKPAGQVAIDRLVERLREDGLGLEAAKLLIEYGGYGDDPETARDLYGKLRDLLRDRSIAE
jgi:hypothetical protein